MALRRVDLDRTKEESILYHLRPDEYFLLANTAGCYTAEEAVRYAARILVEQNAAMALAISHRGYVLETGEVVLQGSASELAGNDFVRQAYLGG